MFLVKVFKCIFRPCCYFGVLRTMSETKNVLVYDKMFLDFLIKQLFKTND